VYNYARYRCGDAETADDLAAQTFERALAHLSGYDPRRAPIGAWLFCIARNLVNDYLRAARRRECLALETCDGHPAPAASPEELLIQVEAQAELLTALARLSERERDLLSLKFAAGLTNRRIAEVTGLSETNVGVILYRALQHLRLILAAA
jgi:RNA polymerase sigma-70 factor (ECF subfamily)